MLVGPNRRLDQSRRRESQQSFFEKAVDRLNLKGKYKCTGKEGLEWVAISFSNAWKWKVKVKSLSGVRLLTTPWTAAYQVLHGDPWDWKSRRQSERPGTESACGHDSVRVWAWRHTAVPVLPQPEDSHQLHVVLPAETEGPAPAAEGPENFGLHRLDRECQWSKPTRPANQSGSFSPELQAEDRKISVLSSNNHPFQVRLTGLFKQVEKQLKQGTWNIVYLQKESVQVSFHLSGCLQTFQLEIVF